MEESINTPKEQWVSKTFDIKTFNLDEANNMMKNGSEGSFLKVTVIDSKGKQGTIEYIKQADNTWHQQKIT